ncbi:signal peptidase I [Paenibacillus tarimensis]
MNKPVETNVKSTKSWKREVREWGVSIIAALGVSMLIQTYAFAQTEVHNISMQNTLVEGQRLIEDKLSYHFTGPKRGDIVIINGPESDVRLVKRLIALPGDVVDIRNGKLYLNGEVLEEPYTKGKTYPLGLDVPLTVPKGEVLVLGDNREHSTDSREIGTIAISSLEGKAIFRLWPLSQFGGLR